MNAYQKSGDDSRNINSKVEPARSWTNLSADTRCKTPFPRPNTVSEECVAVTSMLLCFGLVSVLPLALLASAVALVVKQSQFAALFITITVASTFLPIGKMWPAFRHSAVFNTWRRHFRMRIITPPQPFMDLSRHYLCAQFPHGTFPMACWLNPALVGLPGSGMPGPTEGVVASILLQLPYVRHLFAWIGAHPADKQTLAALLQRTSVGMQPEGIAGIFCGATPKDEAVFLSERKGFVRVAIQAGVDILPVYHIGNSQMFTFWGHRGLSRWLRISVGVFWGRYGLPLPRRHDIISLVGRPIPVKQADDPSAAEVDRVHAAVVAAIKNLFDQHKHLIPGWQHKVLQIK